VVVEKLLGPKFAVQAHIEEMKQLAQAEAEQVFEEIRGRIMGGDALETQPPGIDGLAILVRAHPSLQTNLLDLLHALPHERCGMWPVQGWGGVIVDPGANASLDALLARWASSPSPSLKAAAATAIRTRKGPR